MKLCVYVLYGAEFFDLKVTIHTPCKATRNLTILPLNPLLEITRARGVQPNHLPITSFLLSSGVQVCLLSKRHKPLRFKSKLLLLQRILDFHELNF